MLLVHNDLLTVLDLQTKSYIPPMHPYASLLLYVSPFAIHYEVLTLRENVPKPLTLSENQLLKQRRKKKRDRSVVFDFKRELTLNQLTSSRFHYILFLSDLVVSASRISVLFDFFTVNEIHSIL